MESYGKVQVTVLLAQFPPRCLRYTHVVCGVVNALFAARVTPNAMPICLPHLLKSVYTWKVDSCVLRIEELTEPWLISLLRSGHLFRALTGRPDGASSPRVGLAVRAPTTGLVGVIQMMHLFKALCPLPICFLWCWSEMAKSQELCANLRPWYCGPYPPRASFILLQRKWPHSRSTGLEDDGVPLPFSPASVLIQSCQPYTQHPPSLRG